MQQHQLVTMSAFGRGVTLQISAFRLSKSCHDHTDYPQGFSRTTGSATFDKPFPLYEEIELTLPYYRNRFRGIERSNKNWVLLDGIFGNTYM